MRRLGLLAIAVALLAGCGGEDSSPQGRDADADPTTSSPAAEGVELEGETLDGRPLSLADFRGTPVFVNVWASW
jgi:cytochrome oxidase Cu insertion factor (SCO1/SenC/PrrC family)